MKFKEWFSLNEISEPFRPLGNVTRNKITKDAGTYKQRGVLEFRFKTTKGNEIKLHFEKLKDEENGYDIMFYVNDTQFDAASGSQRNSEILGNILWLIRKKANLLNAKILTFTAQKGDGDTKIIRGLDINRYKPNALLELDKMREIISHHQVQMLKKDAALYIKLNRPVTPDYPDVDKEKYLKILSKYEFIINNITNGSKQSPSPSPLHDLLNNTIHLFEQLDVFGINSKKFIDSMKLLDDAEESNTEMGLRKYRNRREFVWEKLVNKHLSDWIVDKQGTKFKLTRKNLSSKQFVENKDVIPQFKHSSQILEWLS